MRMETMDTDRDDRHVAEGEPDLSALAADVDASELRLAPHPKGVWTCDDDFDLGMRRDEWDALRMTR